MHRPDQAAASATPRYAWYVVAVLLLLNVSSFIDRQVLFLLTTPIQADFGLTDTQVSLVQGPAFAFTFAFAVFIVGRLADRRSRTAIIAWGVAFWSAMCMATGITNTYGQLLATRVGVGAGEATLSPTAATLIADYFPPERLATAMSVFTSGVFFGSGLAYFIGGTVIELVSNQSWSLPLVGDIRPWQRVFLAVGLPGFLLALLTLTIREPRRSHLREAPATFTLGEVIAWFRRHGLAYITFGVAISLYSVVNFGTAAWFPAYFERVHDWTPGKIGLFMGGATAIFGVVGVIAGGQLRRLPEGTGPPDEQPAGARSLGGDFGGHWVAAVSHEVGTGAAHGAGHHEHRRRGALWRGRGRDAGNESPRDARNCRRRARLPAELRGTWPRAAISRTRH